MGAEFHYISEFTLTMLYIKISVGAVAAFSAKEDIKFLDLKAFQIKAVPRTVISSLVVKGLLLGRERVRTVCYKSFCASLRGIPAMRIQEEKGSWTGADAESAWMREELSCLPLSLWICLPPGFPLFLMLCVISVPRSNHGSGLVLPTLESN